jgi:hypothetical protein
LLSAFTGVTAVADVYWPFAFPRSDANPPLQPVQLSDRLYYLSGIDSLGPSLEKSYLAGQNVARLIATSALAK